MFRLLWTSSTWGGLTLALFADLWAIVLALKWMVRRNSRDWLLEFAIEVLYLAIPSTFVGAIIGAIVLPVATATIVYGGIGRSFWWLAHAFLSGAICYLGAVLFVRVAFSAREHDTDKIPIFAGILACLAGMATGWRLSHLDLI